MRFLLVLFLLEQVIITNAKVFVSLTFDDSFTEHYEASKILETYGMAGTFYMNSLRINKPNDIPNSRYISYEKMMDMHNNSHEIAGHTLNHINLDSVDDVVKYEEICSDRNNFLLDFGLDITSFAYPFGKRNFTKDYDCENFNASNVPISTDPNDYDYAFYTYCNNTAPPPLYNCSSFNQSSIPVYNFTYGNVSDTDYQYFQYYMYCNSTVSEDEDFIDGEPDLPSEAVAKLVPKCGYTSARAVGGMGCKICPFCLKCRSGILLPQTPQQFQMRSMTLKPEFGKYVVNAMETALTYNPNRDYWLIFVVHALGNFPGNRYATTWESFKYVLDSIQYLDSIGVVTVDEMINGDGNYTELHRSHFIQRPIGMEKPIDPEAEITTVTIPTTTTTTTQPASAGKVVTSLMLLMIAMIVVF
jgi:peptidoglycan/xylan/chitin deacetylase (PgdA/CDA1 family)